VRIIGSVVAVTVLGLCISTTVMAKDKADGKAAAPAAAPASQPASAPRVLAIVGGTEIKSTQIDVVLSRFIDMPPEARPAVEKRVLGGLIATQAVHAFVLKEKVACSDEELAAAKKELLGEPAEKAKMSIDKFMTERGITIESLRDQACLGKLMNDAASKEKVDEFIKTNPDYFNGTKVRASHVLISCEPMAATDVQQAARAKLEKIGADIKAGKLTFEDAAKQSSSCPSGKQGGDLGEFTFDRMVPSFAATAFKMKNGEVSQIVRSQYGFHLIKVTGRVQGKETLNQVTAAEISKQALRSYVEGRLIDMALADCPIVIMK
jgi:hypothetical protein